MPTTDPGSDLLFSTDDEYIDSNGFVSCYGTMPSRIRRHLLKSELQRRYIEEIGEEIGLEKMPPELIITSPSNKGKQKNQLVRILYKPAAAKKYERKSHTTNELPFIWQPAKRTRSCHNLNTATQAPSLSTYLPTATKNKSQSPFYRPLSKREILSKEDLDIKLSLKKKIWGGIQPDDISFDIDRTRPLSWVAPHTLKSKKMTDEQNYSIDLNLAKLSSSNNKNLEDNEFLTACSRKLMEWQRANANPDNTSTCSQKYKVPLKLAVPAINQDRTIYILKHLTNIKTPCPTIFSSKSNNETIRERKPGRSTTISKVAEAGKILTKLAKSKSRNMSTSYHAANKQPLNQHRSHVRGNKFKTGGLVVTATQIGTSGGATSMAKKNKKLKSLHHKLPQVNSCNTYKPEYDELRRYSAHTNNNNSNNKCSPVTTAAAMTATTIVRKVKTKLKKKKLSSNTKQETSINLNSINNNKHGTITVK